MHAVGDFVLLVDKPEGPTSHDVVGMARKALGTRRVGHTGTLDPFASGLLLLCVGKATRLAEYFSALDKSYDAIAHLGVSTDTLDREGEAVMRSDAWADLTEERITEVLARFRGDIRQVPPIFSAKKVGGERAHRMARRGEEVALPPSDVTIRSLEVTALALPSLSLRVRCSTGTYVRALARDIGDALGVGAHLTSLRRTAIGPWQVEEAVSTDDLADAERVADASVEPLASLGHLETVTVNDEAAARLVQGQAIPFPSEDVVGADTGASAAVPNAVAVAHDGTLLAVGEAAAGVLRPRKVFAA